MTINNIIPITTIRAKNTVRKFSRYVSMLVFLVPIVMVQLPPVDASSVPREEAGI